MIRTRRLSHLPIRRYLIHRAERSEDRSKAVREPGNLHAAHQGQHAQQSTGVGGEMVAAGQRKGFTKAIAQQRKKSGTY